MNCPFRSTLLALALSLQPSLFAATIYVDSTPSGVGNDGTTWADAYSDLQDALTASASGDEIWVAAGTYTPGIARADTFQLKTGVALYGGFSGAEAALNERNPTSNLTILSGDLDGDDDNGGDNSENSYHILVGSGTDATAVLDGFTITAGNANGSSQNGGGALYNNAGSPTLTNCVFSGNWGVFGGAIYSESSSPTLTNCTLSGNSTINFGGAIYNSSSSPTLTNCTLSGNSANYGGAIYNSSYPSPTLTNCSLSGNSATNNGGAIYSYSSSPTLTNCTLSGNSTTNYGGAIYNSSSSPTLTNCTLSGNSASYGGAIFNYSHSSTLTNCIIWNNEANGVINTTSASVYNRDNNSTPTYSYCLIANLNPAGTGNLDGTDSNNDPLFASPTDLRLQVGSPAIDAGNNTANSELADITGSSRVVDGDQDGTATIDLGAYEQADLIYVDASASGLGNGTTWDDAFTSLQDALALATDHQIWVAASTYTPDLGSAQTLGDRTATFQLLSGVAIYGGFSGTETSLDQRNSTNNVTTLSGDLDGDDDNGGDNSENSYYVLVGSGTDATAVLDGFTITAGNAGGGRSGGGLNNDAGSPTLSNCVFSKNSAANAGGAIFNKNSSAPTLTNCVFTENSAQFGGAILNNASSPTLTNCSLTANSATSNGGAINNQTSSSPTLTNCVFTENSAEFGGAILNNASSPTLTNCSISANAATSNGGAIFNTSSSSPTLANCIIWNNEANGVINTASASVRNNDPNSTPTYSYCLIANLEPAGTGNLDGTDSNNDPLFVSSADLSLQIGSPAIDAGSQAAYEAAGGSTSDLDLSDNDRFVDDLATANPATETSSYLDLGAYEAYDLSAPTIQSFTLTTTETTGATTLEFALSFDETVLNLDSADDLTISTTGTAAYSGLTITGSGNSYTITLTGIIGGGNFGIAIKTDSGVTDRWGNAMSANTGIENVSRISTRHYVNESNASPAAPYDTWATAATNPQDVLALAASGDQIWVAQGIYTPDPDSAPTLGDRSATFQLLSAVALYGGFSGTETSLDQRNPAIYLTILSGDLDGDDTANFGNNTENSYHVLVGSGTDATAVLDGFTITAGNADGGSQLSNGGALYNNTGSPTVINCSFSENAAATNGGAIYNRTASPALTDCSFTGNSAASGGGAIHNSTSSPTLTNCSFVGNSATSNGGAINNSTTSSPTLTNCSFTGNSAANGGAMNITTFSSPTLINCIFSANSATSTGGAIRNHTDSSATFINCTLSGNSATTSGGAMRHFNAAPTLTNCIIWNNSAAGATDTTSASLDNASSTPIYNYCLVENFSETTLDASGSNNLDGTDTNNDPLFVSPGDLRLQFGSPAIGAGDNSTNNEATDLDGNTRIVNTIDLGAYESTAPDTTEVTQWAAAQGLDASNGYPTDDPDGDQRTNLEEFAFDSDPNDATNDGKIQHTIETFAIRGEEIDLFILTLPVRDGATFTGNPLSATIDGITYTIEGSLDLQSFDQSVITAPALQNTPALTTGWIYQGFTLGNDTSSQSKGFLRVTISEAVAPE
ncbi:right-handed parallel beta-helix repeat-containing protein [Lentimonas sp. CC11]|uniref:beta strand repeat-containing protein n=1 Tax=Lentimonas sp. CC11 TaxID=2676096 RepID=UPI00135572E2|nr:right-handed parallel beta-helix repeat-containing protein [Lentimonas sp. CC11]CAA7069612.1 Alkaline phosphatase (EC [Lentimonas sp. CC11]